MTKHMAKAHSLKYVYEFNCKQCDIKFKSRYSLNRHNTRKHTQKGECGECGKKFANLNMHISKMHHSPMLHACPLCCRIFKRKMGLDRHIGFCAEKTGDLSNLVSVTLNEGDGDVLNPSLPGSHSLVTIDERRTISFPSDHREESRLVGDVTMGQMGMTLTVEGAVDDHLVLDHHHNNLSDDGTLNNPITAALNLPITVNSLGIVTSAPLPSLGLASSADHPSLNLVNSTPLTSLSLATSASHPSLSLVTSASLPSLNLVTSASLPSLSLVSSAPLLSSGMSPLPQIPETPGVVAFLPAITKSDLSASCDIASSSGSLLNRSKVEPILLNVEAEEAFPSPIILTGLDTETALATLSNKEVMATLSNKENAPHLVSQIYQIQNQFRFDTLAVNIEGDSQNVIECTGLDDAVLEDMKRLAKKGRNNRMVLCRVCPGQKLVRNLQKHMDKFHTSKPKKQKEMARYQCELCGYKTDRVTNYTIHVKTVHLKDRTVCHLCGKEYSNINQHIRVIHKMAKSGLKTKESCGLCGQEYYDIKQHLRRAHQIVEEQKDTTCNYCGEKFSKYSNMIRHIRRIHQGVKETCQICLKQVSNLKKHQKTHKDVMLPSLPVTTTHFVIDSGDHGLATLTPSSIMATLTPTSIFSSLTPTSIFSTLTPSTNFSTLTSSQSMLPNLAPTSFLAALPSSSILAAPLPSSCTLSTLPPSSLLTSLPSSSCTLATLPPSSLLTSLPSSSAPIFTTIAASSLPLDSDTMPQHFTNFATMTTSAIPGNLNPIPAHLLSPAIFPPPTLIRLADCDEDGSADICSQPGLIEADESKDMPLIL